MLSSTTLRELLKQYEMESTKFTAKSVAKIPDAVKATKSTTSQKQTPTNTSKLTNEELLIQMQQMQTALAKLQKKNKFALI